ncbi:hypothetical protein [Streptomyces sp. NPDC101132]|uniref:hypothetical protein n=1 Tax=Streptomyces sp. NPDC101132 TaxID=3366110 RepID=UPI00381AFB90
MTADEARELHEAMSWHGVPGAPAPVSPTDPAGEWGIYRTAADGTLLDVTEEARSAVEAARLRQPRRGFVIPQVC